MLPRDKSDFPRMLHGIRALVRGNITAEMVVAAVSNSLVERHFPLLPRLTGTTRKVTKAAPVGAFADWLGTMDLTDVGFWLSSAYSHLVHEDRRRKRAMFFTPPALGNRMLDDLDAAGIDWSSARIIDIACGGAAFLAPAAARVADARAALGDNAQKVLQHVEQHLAGIEIEPFLARLSQLFVGMHLYRWIAAAGRQVTIAITVGDAMKHAQILAGQFDAVICNPPYRKLTRAEVARLPEFLRELCFFQPNLYAMFMALSARLLTPTGVAGLLTPTSFLSGQSFLKLRRFLAACGHLKRIDLVEKKEGVFLGVEQDTAITVFGPKRRRATRTEVFAAVADDRWSRLGNVFMESDGGPWILPRSSSDAKLLAAANGCTITDYGYAPATGDVMLYRDKRRRFGTLAAARRAKAKHPVPMLRATEISRDGSLVFQRDRRPDCYVDAGDTGQGVLRGPAVMLQRVTSPNQSRRLNCAPVPRALQREYDGVIGENHVTFLVAGTKPAASPTLLARIMNSDPVDRLFRCRSGANNVSVYELAHLPLPNPEVVRKELAKGTPIDDAVRAGFGIHPVAYTKKKKHGLPTR